MNSPYIQGRAPIGSRGGGSGGSRTTSTVSPAGPHVQRQQRNRIGSLGAWVVVQSCCVDCCAVAVALILTSLSVAASAQHSTALKRTVATRPFVHTKITPLVHTMGKRAYIAIFSDSEEEGWLAVAPAASDVVLRTTTSTPPRRMPMRRRRRRRAILPRGGT